MTTHRSLILALLVGASSALAACGGGGGGDIAIDDLESEFVDELCASLTACGQFPDIASCKESADFSFDQLRADVEAGLADYDGGRARECLNSFTGPGCSLFGSSEENDACDTTFNGKVELGGECFSSEVCAGDASCDGDETETCTPGVCVARGADAGEGESCAEADCEGELRCNESEICEAPPGLGDACEGLFECVGGSICQLGVDNTPGTCVELPGTGETCDPELGGEFLGGQFSCLETTDFCDPSDNICKAKLPPGSDCSAVSNSCVNYAECVEGSCEASPGLGDSCVIDGELSCLGDLECEGGTCALEPPEAVCTLP